jgi:hypothetical protein
VRSEEWGGRNGALQPMTRGATTWRLMLGTPGERDGCGPRVADLLKAAADRE